METPHKKNEKNQCFYELLGAPSLMYRHAPSYSDVSPLTTTSPPTLSAALAAQEARNLHRNHVAVNRVRARWYTSLDHPFRQKCQVVGVDGVEESTVSQRKRKQRRTETETDNLDEEAKRKLELSALNQADPFQQEPFLYSSSRGLEAARQSMLMFPRDEFLDHTYYERHLRSHHIYSQNYVPGRVWQHDSKMRKRLPKHRLAMSRHMTKERHDADVAYLAPADISSLEYALHEESDVVDFNLEKKKSSDDVTIPQTNRENEALLYGNCLVCAPCPCRQCLRSTRTSSGSSASEPPSGWCVIHPTGEILSEICVSKLRLPGDILLKSGNDNGVVSGKDKTVRRIDIDEPVRQIEQCSKWQTRASLKQGIREETSGMFIARSPSYCTVFSVRSMCKEEETDTTTTEPESGVGRSRNGVSDSCESSTLSACCSGVFETKEICRIDLRSWYSSEPSYRPIDVTCHPNYGNEFVDAKAAILSECSRRKEINTIHHATISCDIASKPCITQHSISCLKTISEIAFTSSHPMTLWAAARSYVRPVLSRRKQFKMKRPMLGHGNALYTIDLRTNDAVFQWSPSAEEALSEGIHSVCGIRTDWQRPHNVWVTSSSAAKIYEIDGRMPCRAVNSWSLTGACDDFGATVPTTGLFGSGTILTQPQPPHSEFHRQPILSVQKKPAAFGINLCQRPIALPRFATRSLECVASTGISSLGPTSSVCTSSVFALPDESEKTFTCGIAAVRTPVSRILPNISSLGYEEDPTEALCVVTVTNKGDIFSHTLLECNANIEGRAQSFPDLPLGCTAVPIPETELDSVQNGVKEKDKHASTAKMVAEEEPTLKLKLSNTFPVSSDAVMPFTPRERNECRPFKTIRMEQLPIFPLADTESVERRTSNQGGGEEQPRRRSRDKVVAVDHPVCALGSVTTSSGVPNGRKNQQSITFPSRYLDAAETEMRAFADHFGKSDPMHDELLPERDEAGPRADLTHALLITLETEWDNQGDIESVVVKEEEDSEMEEGGIR